MIRTFLAAALLALAALATQAPVSPAQAQGAKADPENTLYLQTKDGRVTIRLRPDLAPKHVERIKILTRQGFYDGLKFHRVMDNFMAQTGDPNGDGSGGSKLPDLPAEFSREPYKRGTLGMARSNAPNSANSQFFICTGECSFLTGQYTVFGEVVSGIELVDRIKKAPAGSRSGTVSNPDVIVKMQLAADAK